MVNWGKLIFGGVDSSEYGIYITGEGVYNAPERAVEFVDIPGRNGAVAIDQGRYENIVVTYPAGVFGKDPEEFREALSDFRNAILSQKGYQRLEDTYHPEEFREAIYVAGIEVEPSQKKAGKFELTFNCKPQRWLTIGDYPIPVESGDVLQNPTLFDARPLVELLGYGNIIFNGFTISLDDGDVGLIEVAPRSSEENPGNFTKTYLWDTSLINTGDTVTIDPAVFTYYITSNTAMYSNVSYSIDGTSTITPTVSVPSYTAYNKGNSLVSKLTFPKITASIPATSGNAINKYAKVTVTGTKDVGGTDSVVIEASIIIGPNNTRIQMSVTVSGTPTVHHLVWNVPATMVNSSVNLLGNPTYIDCEYGEAYRIDDDEYQSLNRFVDLGSELPALSPGTNKIIFDNTITDLKISPRWWKV